MPKSIYLLTGLIVGLIFTNADAQKIKYKDLYVSLNAKQYDTAIPQLEAFLKDPKNEFHANGNLQMGLYFESLANGYDLIKDSTVIISTADTAVSYLSRAKELINDKELKKNDEFYQAFYRRDLRTGDFGIKVSDVHLDIEKKLQSLGSIVDYGTEIYKNLYSTNAANEFAFNAYARFVAQYEDEKSFHLMADEEVMKTLQEIVDKEDHMKETFDDARSAVSKIGKKGYSPELEFQPIDVFGEDGLSEVDFFQNDVLAWDYGEWAYNTKKAIEEEVGSLKSDILAFNEKIKAENELLKGLEITPYESISHEIDPTMVEKLMDLDENPLPIKLFTIQIKKNEFDFITKESLNPRIANEGDVDYQLIITDSLVQILDEIEEDIALLQEDYIMDGKKKYASLVEAYGGDFGLIKLRQQYEGFLETARLKWDERNQFYTKKSKWGVSVSGEDSIYLTPDAGYRLDAKSTGYYTAAVFKDSISKSTYVIGLELDKKKGFMAMISNAREITWKENFELGTFAFDNSTSSVGGSFMPSQEGRVAAYLYSQSISAKSNLMAVSADVVGQIAWSNALKVINEPADVKFNTLVKETVLYMMSEEDMETASGAEVLYYVIDRSGKVR